MAYWLLIGVILLTSCSSIPEKSQDNLKLETLQILITPDINKPKYVIINLATYQLRVYQLNSPDGPGELIFTAPVVIGRDKAGERTLLGNFQITKWQQFYQDYQKKYDPWINQPPPPGSHRKVWGKTGAFGWYTAKLFPSPEGQWLHGTVGWGSEADRFISPVTSPSGAKLRIKSHGCIRLSNQAISWLKENVPVGSWVFRVYAKEQVIKASPDKILEFSHKLKYQGKIIEENSWKFRVKTEAISVVEKEQYQQGNLNTNPYEIPVGNLGILIVDQGQLLNYSPPKQLPKASVQTLPKFVIFKGNEGR